MRIPVAIYVSTRSHTVALATAPPTRSRQQPCAKSWANQRVQTRTAEQKAMISWVALEDGPYPALRVTSRVSFCLASFRGWRSPDILKRNSQLCSLRKQASFLTNHDVFWSNINGPWPRNVTWRRRRFSKNKLLQSACPCVVTADCH